MFEKVLIFVTFLGPLVFFHELGHFLFARLFNIRVEVFSIGFGPKLLSWKFKDTIFTISLIPLGGYVKMFGDDPLGRDSIPEEQKKFAFNHQGKWARFCVAFGGPLANFILAFVLFCGLSFLGEKVPKLLVGSIDIKSDLYTSGLRIGDEIVKINMTEIEELSPEFLDDNLQIKNIQIIPYLNSVNTDSQLSTISLNINGKKFKEELFKSLPYFRKSIVVDQRGNLNYLSADLKHLSKEKIASTSLEFYYSLSLKKLDKLVFYRTKIDEKNQDYLVDFSRKKEVLLKNDFGEFNNLEDWLIYHKYFPVDLVIKQVLPDSAASKASLQEGDILTNLNKIPLSSFEHLRTLLQKTKENESVELSYIRNAQTYSISLFPQINMVDKKKIVQIGIYSNAQFLPFEFKDSKPIGFVDSIVKGAKRTWDGTVMMVSGFIKLITYQVSLDQVGGPLAIGKVANEGLSIGISFFLKLMAMISLNLGVINLFPIPVLDGGHILFIMLELVNRGPLSRKKIELAHQFGMSLLFLLIFVSLFNDISRLM